MSIGVYRIRCLKTNRSYIGGSINHEARIHWHKWTLKVGRHHCSPLQQDWNLYGKENFVFETIERCKTAMLLKREQFWLKKENQPYNIHPNAGTAKGYVHRPETIVKMKEGRAKFLEKPWARKMLSDKAKRQHAEGKFG